jgi:integrase
LIKREIFLSFIIGCRTGLRVSDYNKCIGDNVETTGLICIDETDKTGDPVYIPMHWQVKEILDKYNGLPALISDQKLNVFIKDLCKLAEFDQRVKDTREGKQKPEGSGEYCKKYELVTTHTARRSCATNLYLAGFDLYFIQGILGHKKIETTIGYLGATRKALALKMVDNPYFKK